MAGILGRIFGGGGRRAATPQPQASTLNLSGQTMDSQQLAEFMAGGGASTTQALGNAAVMRAVSLISNAMGMLPLALYDRQLTERATGHPAHALISGRPNGWQTQFELRQLMQARVLVHGNAYAVIIRSAGKPLRIVPVADSAMQPELTDTLEMRYTYTRPDGGRVVYGVQDVLHVRAIGLDAERGESPVKLARTALDIARAAEQASSAHFRNGMQPGGSLSHPGRLGEEAYERLKQSMSEEYGGARNAGKWLVVEEGMTATQFGGSGRESQLIESRAHQVEEVARIFGVPRSLLAMDGTSWGTGIEQLGLGFVQYTLAPWITAWEQALARCMLSPAEQSARRYYFKFNERALLRGSMKDQAEVFARALGAGGTRPWMTTNEVRRLSELPESDDPGTDSLTNPMTQPAAPQQGS